MLRFYGALETFEAQQVKILRSERTLAQYSQNGDVLLSTLYGYLKKMVWVAIGHGTRSMLSSMTLRYE